MIKFQTTSNKKQEVFPEMEIAKTATRFSETLIPICRYMYTYGYMCLYTYVMTYDSVHVRANMRHFRSSGRGSNINILFCQEVKTIVFDFNSIIVKTCHVSFIIQICSEAVDGCVSTNSQVIESEGLSTLAFFNVLSGHVMNSLSEIIKKLV